MTRWTTVILAHPWAAFARLVLITVGGVLVLQSSDRVDPAKLAYLVVAGISVIMSAVHAWQIRNSQPGRASRGLLFAMFVLLAVVAISLPVALAHGVGASAWLRDAVAYGLFAVVALVALDSHAVQPRWLVGLALVIGALATVSYAAVWLDRRSIADVSIDRLVLASGALASMFFVIASSFSFRARRGRLWWAAIAGVSLGLFIVVGTRSRLPFILLPILLGVLAGGGLRRNLPSWVVHVIAAAALIIAVPLLQGAATPQGGAPGEAPSDGFGRRVDSIDDLITNPGRDASMRERISQTVAAWQVFVSDPVLGAGPGLEIEWTDYAGDTQRGYALDSPLTLLAKFGIIGAVAAAVWIVAFARFSRVALHRLRGSAESLILVGFSVVLVYGSLFLPPMQDKGTSFALMVILALVMGRAFDAREQTVTRAPEQTRQT
jgi:hypothetical protein